MLMYPSFSKHRGGVIAGHNSPFQNASAAAAVGDAVIKPMQTDADTIQAPLDLIYGEITIVNNP